MCRTAPCLFTIVYSYVLSVEFGLGKTGVLFAGHNLISIRSFTNNVSCIVHGLNFVFETARACLEQS